MKVPRIEDLNTFTMKLEIRRSGDSSWNRPPLKRTYHNSVLSDNLRPKTALTRACFSRGATWLWYTFKMDDMGGDCSTDGTCEADSGDPEMSEGNAAGEKVSLLQGTSLAIQQFSIIIGVALLVGILFFLMIGIELTMDWALTKLSEKCCKKKHNDEEDPAALVGSFKRYKN